MNFLKSPVILIFFILLTFMGGGAFSSFFYFKDRESEKQLQSEKTKSQTLRLDLDQEKSKNELLETSNADYEREVTRLDRLVKEKDQIISTAQNRVGKLQQQVNELQDSTLRLAEITKSYEIKNNVLTKDWDVAMLNLEEKLKEIEGLQRDKKALEGRIGLLSKESKRSSAKEKESELVSSNQNVGNLSLSPPSFLMMAIIFASFILGSWKWVKSNVLFYKSPIV